jgi:primosomal protein N' (replication factor Y)
VTGREAVRAARAPEIGGGLCCDGGVTASSLLPDAATAEFVDRPVARVAVDVSLPHLDRPFDYEVPGEMSALAVPGARVRVRFAGKDVAGYVLDRTATSERAGSLKSIRRVVSAEPVLTPDLLRLARAVADRYAGTLADVLRLAIPARHARAEAAVPSVTEPPSPVAPPTPDALGRYVAGAAYLAALARGESPRAVWAALPGVDPAHPDLPRWPAEIAAAVQACLASGRGALVVVPDRRDVDVVAAALRRALGSETVVELTADCGPEARYRRWLTIRRGLARVVVGTRAAAFAPVPNLGLVALWDDGDDSHAEPRAPYPHAREVLLLRAQDGAALLLGGFAVTAEAAALLRTGWARPLRSARPTVRRWAPHVVLADAEERNGVEPARASRLPPAAWTAARAALDHGPVLVQVPRAGYAPSVACADCRQPARCATCHGPLAIVRPRHPPQCRWCGRAARPWQCAACGGQRLRAPVIGSRRTAEELGRAFPAVPVITSGGDRVLASVRSEPAIVVATTGAEPVAAGGYAAALLLDGWLLLARADLRSGEEALRRWFAAASLVRPAHDGGAVVLVAEPSARPAQALVRWDPYGHAERELAQRREVGLPPAVRLATVTGEDVAVREFVATLELPADAEVLGSTEVGAGDLVERRAVIRAPRRRGPELAHVLHLAMAARSSRKAPGAVRVQVDPAVLA